MDPQLRTWVVVGAGQSLTEDQLAHVKGRARVIVANNAYHLAPWADALAACDSKWWRHYGEDARQFAGRKFAPRIVAGVEHVRTKDHPEGCNSGLYAMMVARELGAERLLLLGFDMHGQHFFGKHPLPLSNQSASRFVIHMRQFDRFSGPKVLNCTPHSALKTFENASIYAEI